MNFAGWLSYPISAAELYTFHYSSDTSDGWASTTFLASTTANNIDQGKNITNKTKTIMALSILFYCLFSIGFVPDWALIEQAHHGEWLMGRTLYGWIAVVVLSPLLLPIYIGNYVSRKLK